MEPAPSQQPPSTGQMPQKKPECSLAVASVICGGLSFFFSLLTAIPAVITGHMALNELKRNPDQYNESSRTMAIAGLIMGYLFIGMTVLMILFFIFVIGIMATAAA